MLIHLEPNGLRKVTAARMLFDYGFTECYKLFSIIVSVSFGLRDAATLLCQCWKRTFRPGFVLPPRALRHRPVRLISGADSGSTSRVPESKRFHGRSEHK